MAHKTKVGGTAYEITGGAVKVGGTKYSIKKGRTKVGGTGYDINFSNLPANFADATWAEIIEACQTNTVPDTWEVGDQKAMTINGTSYMIDIIGKNHTAYADGSGKAPLTFQMHDCYKTQYPMDDSAYGISVWPATDMKKTQMPAILALMPSEVQAGIKEVLNPYSANLNGTSIVNSRDKLFFLSYMEIFGNKGNAVAIEGTQYEYYAAGNSKLKKVNGTVSQWWTRSFSASNDEGEQRCCVVYTTEGQSSRVVLYNSRGVAPAFCF